jgi:hypothetical protein
MIILLILIIFCLAYWCYSLNMRIDHLEQSNDRIKGELGRIVYDIKHGKK